MYHNTVSHKVLTCENKCCLGYRAAWKLNVVFTVNDQTLWNVKCLCENKEAQYSQWGLSRLVWLLRSVLQSDDELQEILYFSWYVISVWTYRVRIVLFPTCIFQLGCDTVALLTFSFISHNITKYIYFCLFVSWSFHCLLSSIPNESLFPCCML